MQQNRRRHRGPACRPLRSSQEYLIESAGALINSGHILTGLPFIALDLVWGSSDDASSSMVISECASGLIQRELCLWIAAANTTLSIIEGANAAINTTVDFHLKRALTSL